MSRRRIIRPLLAGLVAVTVGVGLLSGTAAATAAGSPTGHLDQLRLVGGNLVLSGWSYDANQPTTGRVDIYRTTPTRVFRGHVSTTVVRADVNRALHITGTHGWTFTTPAYSGTQTWCAYGINVGAGANASLGCITITVPAGHSPSGAVDSVNDDGISTTLSGWALDRDDLQGPESVDIYRMTPVRTFVSRVHTTVVRPDLNARFKVTGDHGWTAALPDLPGQAARYCAYALNLGTVATNPQIGCVDVAAGPAAGTISATSVQVGSRSAAVTVSVVALPGKPTLRVTRQLSTAAGDGWSATVVTEVPLTSTRYFTFSDAGLTAGTSYRYSFFLHDAAGNHTPGYQLDVTTDQVVVANHR